MTRAWGRLGAIARERIGAGLLVGAAAFWVLYGVMTLLVYLEPGFSPASLWDWGSYYLYSAHNVPVWGTALGEIGRYNVLQLPGGGGVLPTIAYYAMPVVGLVAGGYAVRSGASPNLDRLESAAAGATVGVGYLAAALLGVVLFSRPAVSEASDRVALYVIGPDLLATVVLIGVAYPLLFGALGGVLADPRP